MFENLSNALSAIWEFIKSAASSAWTWIKTTVTNLINSLVQGAQNTWNNFMNFLSSLWNTITSTAVGAWNGLKASIQGIINGIVQGAQNAWNSMVQSVSNLVSQVTGIFNGLRNINLWDAGRAILDGFLGGLKSAWQGVTDFVGGIAGWIRDHKGPIEYDKRLLIPAGKAIMNGLNEGLKNQFKSVQSTISGMAGDIYDSFGTVTFDTNFSDIDKASSQLTLSNNRLASQLNTDSGQDYDYKDVMDILAKLANRPTVVSVQTDKQEIAKIYAEPVAEEQAKRQAILNAVDGLGW